MPDVTCGVQNVVSHIEEGTQAENVREWGTEKICGPKRNDTTTQWRGLYDIRVTK